MRTKAFADCSHGTLELIASSSTTQVEMNRCVSCNAVQLGRKWFQCSRFPCDDCLTLSEALEVQTRRANHVARVREYLEAVDAHELAADACQCDSTHRDRTGYRDGHYDDCDFLATQNDVTRQRIWLDAQLAEAKAS